MLPKNKSSESAKSADNHNAGTREVLSVIAGDAEETVAGLDSECADEVEAIDRDEVAGENIYNDDTVKKNEDWAIMEPATNAVSLKVDSVADGKINVSFVLSDGDYQSEFFTYDGLFQLVKDDENITVTPPAALSEDDVMIPLDEITTEFVFDYESKYGPLEPGEYTLIGYIYSSKSSPAIPISTTVTIPET